MDKCEGGGEVGYELFAASQDDVVRGEDAEGAASGALAGDEDAAGLGNEGVAGADSSIALLHLVNVVAAVGLEDGKSERGGGASGEVGGVGGDFLPAFGLGDLRELGAEVGFGFAKAEVGGEFFGVFAEESEAFFEGGADKGKAVGD